MREASQDILRAYDLRLDSPLTEISGKAVPLSLSPGGTNSLFVMLQKTTKPG